MGVFFYSSSPRLVLSFHLINQTSLCVRQHFAAGCQETGGGARRGNQELSNLKCPLLGERAGPARGAPPSSISADW